MIFLTLFLIPGLIGLISHFIFPDKITLKELGLLEVISLIIAGISCLIIYNINTSDYEIIHGQVTDKKQVEVHCRHSYSCNCYTICSGSGTSRSCSTHCQTCYEHSNDWDWDVMTTVGTLTIDTIDRRGSEQPPRWTAVKLGEPVAKEHSYENYIKGASDTLFRKPGLIEKYVKDLPKYPGKVYDYYRIDRMVSYLKFQNTYNKSLADINKELGKLKQVSLGMVIVLNKDREYFHALEELWIGGKKNDAILVTSVDLSGNIQWVEVLSWSKNELFKVKLRDDILQVQNIFKEREIISVFRKDVLDLYERRPMKDFEYLKNSIKPTLEQWTWSMIICLILCIIMCFISYEYDIFDEE